MNLEVVLLGFSFPLERCLRQIGAPYRIVGLSGAIPEDSAAYLVPADSAFCRKSVTALLQKKRAVIIPQSMRHFLEETPLLFAYPDDCLDHGYGSTPKIFKVGKLLPREEVATRPTNPVAQLFLSLLAQTFEKQGLFFPALSFFPPGYRTLFSFRVDADEYDPDVCTAFFEKAAPYSKGTTVFFSGANFLNAKPLIQNCVTAGFEVSSHAFHHHTYKSSRQNLYNIRKAADFFDQLETPRTEGFAAPRGRWNPGLQSALADLGYRYSSDFVYDYDSYPSFPFLMKGFSTVLQIPIHPVCSGICLEAAQDPLTYRDLAEYFESVFEKKYHSCEPIIFYDHPTAWTLDQFSLIDRWFSWARNAPDVWVCQFGEFADWCIRRDRLRPRVSQEPYASRVEISCDDMPDAENIYALNLYRRGSAEYAQVRLSKNSSYHETAGLCFFERRIPGNEHGEETPFHKINAFRYCKRLLKQALDWETVTPLDEIIVEDLSTAVKKAMRFLTGTPKL